MGMLIVIGLVFFHTAQIFSGGDFYVMNEPPSMAALAFVAFGSLWGMPLMFLMPFVVAVPLLVPPQVYYAVLRSDPTYQESYLQFLPRFFRVRFTLSEFPLFIEGELFRISTLYFLLYLFTFTLLLLPLFLYLRRPALTALHQRLWHELAAVSAGTVEYYHPERWMPHITLADGDVLRDHLSEIVRMFSAREFAWEIEVNNLALIYDTGAAQEVQLRFDLPPSAD